MISRCPARGRRGYTLAVVVISLMLLLALWTFAIRTTSSVLRVETKRVLQQVRDQGAMNAMGRALQLLEYSKPSDSSNPGRTEFTYGVTLSLADTSGGCSPTGYTVTYTARPDLGPERWAVRVSPGTYSVPLPNIGDSPQWP